MSVLASSLSSTVALVTGGASGIGKAIAEKLASQNIRVVIADVLPVQHYSENIAGKLCDVTNGEDIDALFGWMKDNTGLPDVMVLSAGKGIHEQLLEGDPEKWNEVLDLNVMGVLRCIRAFVPPMKDRGFGEVVFISSVAAVKPYMYGGIYSASKAAVEMIAETLRLETLPDVRITVVAPGVVDTGFFENEVSGNKSAESIGMGSLSAEDIAEDVWYAINKKRGTGINKIITRPAGQDF
jgi:NADP-dependent 3-hydroxy acid dehydrogenase YdfG